MSVSDGGELSETWKHWSVHDTQETTLQCLRPFLLAYPSLPRLNFSPSNPTFRHCVAKSQWPYEMTLCFNSSFFLSSWSPLHLLITGCSLTRHRHTHTLNHKTHTCTLVWPVKGKQSLRWPVEPGLLGECLGNALELWFYQTLSGTNGLCVCVCTVSDGIQCQDKVSKRGKYNVLVPFCPIPISFIFIPSLFLLRVVNHVRHSNVPLTLTE